MPSALGEFSVRGLAGHLVRATTSVEAYLDGPEPEDVPIGPAEYYAAAVGDDIDVLASPLHRSIRERGEELAADGHAALVATLDAALDRLHLRLMDERPDRRLRVFKGLVMTLDDYLVTRMVELLVHIDDLAVSVGLPTPEPSPEAVDDAVRVLVDVARLRHGDVAVLRALTRRERDPHHALRVL
ncbi:MAG: maleylpyruvate isomerase N-terminal domain-containing protein [Actinobacteria bacterium]|nr:maleylpyruvate isomerase N-terminal domain-containing protein [Actinomycetota bacterium]